MTRRSRIVRAESVYVERFGHRGAERLAAQVVGVCVEVLRVGAGGDGSPLAVLWRLRNMPSCISDFAANVEVGGENPCAPVCWAHLSRIVALSVRSERAKLEQSPDS